MVTVSIEKVKKVYQTLPILSKTIADPSRHEKIYSFLVSFHQTCNSEEILYEIGAIPSLTVITQSFIFLGMYIETSR
jgi:hypothetical protein